MIELTLAEVAAATGGTVAGVADSSVRVTGLVEYDSRRVGPGGLFVAFQGERVDGHEFAGQAIAAGAVAVLGTRAVHDLPMVLVDDPLAAMGRLARAVLSRLSELTVVGLTGSSGKTTTKDLLAQVLARLSPRSAGQGAPREGSDRSALPPAARGLGVVAPAGSLNNELGVPHTALRAGPDTRFLVLEMGARGVGDLAYLCQIAPPSIGLVLNVGVAHVGEFGSVDAIAKAKGELVEALPSDGVAVLNADDPRVAAMASRTAATVVRYGQSPDAVVRATGVRLDERGRASYTLVTPDGSVPVRLGLVGAHQVANTLAVAAVARELGLRRGPELAAALGELGPVSSRRMDVFDRPDGVTVIDDSYNANPASTAAALRALVAIGGQPESSGHFARSGASAPPARRPRRTVAVLGYLAELGEYERAGHEEVGALAARLGVDRVVVVGEAAAPIHHGAVARREWGGESVLVADQQAAVAWLDRELGPGDVVLVKGSRYRTWDVADHLRAEAPAGESAQSGEGAP